MLFRITSVRDNGYANKSRKNVMNRTTLALVLCCVLTGAVQAASPTLRDTMAARTAACVACHGKEGRATREGYFPRIAGKSQGYLYNQLINFRDGRRSNPAMNHLVSHLSDTYLNEMAAYFAAQHLPYSAAPPLAAPERGRVLVMQGDASRKLPACIACHGQKLSGVQPSIPGLLGLPRDYLTMQLGAWRTGARRAAAPDCMAHIAQQLAPADVSAIAAWLAVQPVPDDYTPVAGPIKLPIACGSGGDQ
jgi:cytochrome c553